MGWQDVAVFLVVAAALGYLVWKIWPARRRPDVATRDLVRKKRKPRGDRGRE